MITAPNFADLEEIGLVHGFGERRSVYPDDVKTAKQIHSNIVQDAAGPLGEGDAMISNRPGIRIGVKTADCVPVLLVDPATGAIAAIHAGWRGTALNIALATVRELTARFQTDPGNLRAAVGPSIGVCCYEVGPEVASHFGITSSGKVRLDLAAIVEAQLRQAGVSNVWKSAQCTFCTPERFYSFRREREEAGRMVSFIGWRKHVGRTSEGPPGNTSDVL